MIYTYLVPLILAILIGTLRSRRPQALLLWDLRAVFLLPLGLLAGLTPMWLATYWPDLVWTSDRQLLMVTQGLSRGLLVLFVLINLLTGLRAVDWAAVWRGCRELDIRQLLDRLVHPVSNRSSRSVRRFSHLAVQQTAHSASQQTPWPQAAWSAVQTAIRSVNGPTIRQALRIVTRSVLDWSQSAVHIGIRMLRHSYQRVLGKTVVHPHRIHPLEQAAAPLSGRASGLRLIGLLLGLLGLSGQMAVLLTNQGYWPLSDWYLAFIKDPLLVAGIRNGALRLSRLADSQTRLAWLGQVIPWPTLNPRTPAPFEMISITDLVLAISLFLTTLSLFPAPRTKPE